MDSGAFRRGKPASPCLECSGPGVQPALYPGSSMPDPLWNTTSREYICGEAMSGT